MTVDNPDLILNSFGTHFPAEMSRLSSPMADRISAMPDSVPCYILSFLPTKLAVATSVHSKRWKPIWLSLLTLDFDDESFEGFLHFVYSVLLSRDPTLPVHSLHLKLCNSSDCDQYDINRFVHFAAQRGLKNLTLHLYGIKLPPGVVEATTLAVLNLKMLIVNDLPFDDFPSLKTLHLDRVIFESYECLQKLLSACPILEDLESKDLGVVGSKRFLPRKKVKRLTNLVKANICDQHIPFTSLYNAEFLHVDMKNVHILYYDHPTFVNLIHLELSFEREDYDKKWDPESSYGRWEWRWEWVLEGLEHCPKLQNLNILDESYWIYEEWMEAQTVAECLSSQLRTFSLRSYNGTRNELKFVKYIMQNSKVLRNMTIQSSRDVETDEKLQMLMQLSSCPMGSTACKLLFN